MNQKLRKNGFTLIELLAVILILGIIALIAIPTVNDILKESKMSAFNTTAVALGNKVEETCQLESLKDGPKTSLYTIVEGKLDKPLEIKGDLPREGYILVNDKCEVAYSFYDENNVVSKNFLESKAIVNNKNTAPAYGLKWQSNTVEGANYLDDTYTRTLDASSIDDASVKAQIGNTPVTNAFDELDIYKDILPYTDEFGNEFMLIPKFYISKTKEITDTEIIWNYAVSKHKLDDTYYLPSNFVDEGVDNNKHIELPYVLIGKYEAGSETVEGVERLVSKTGIMPKTNININQSRTLATKYNELENINGYQQYDIHVNDLITTLFAIEFKTMNSQSIMSGYVNKAVEDGSIKTGGSDLVSSSSGSLLSINSPSKYRGIENLWGNIWSLVDGVTIDQTKDINTIYTSLNSRYYSSGNITKYYKELEGYKKLNTSGYVKEKGFDKNVPFINFAIEVNENIINDPGDYYLQDTNNIIKVIRHGGYWSFNDNSGLSAFCLDFEISGNNDNVGSRIVKTPLR